MKATTRISAGVLALVTVLGACGGSDSSEQPPLDTTPTTTIAPLTTSIASYVASAEDFSVLTDLLAVAGLTKQLSGEGSFTLLAPTDDAFSAMSATELDALKADKATLKKLLLNHVLDTELMSIDMLEGTTPAMSGHELAFIPGDPTTVDGIDIVTVDTRVENGVIHAIDAIITG